MSNTKKKNSKTIQKKSSTVSKKKPALTLLGIGGVIVLIFILIGVLQNVQHIEALKNYNPYGDRQVSSPTKDLLSDKNYQNIILPEALEERLATGEPTTVYFFSPTCQYCKETTPIVAPLTKEMGIDLVQYNILEFTEGWEKYGIEATPTIVHYINGQEVGRLVGSQPKPMFEKWFKSIIPQ